MKLIHLLPHLNNQNVNNIDLPNNTNKFNNTKQSWINPNQISTKHFDNDYRNDIPLQTGQSF